MSYQTSHLWRLKEKKCQKAMMSICRLIDFALQMSHRRLLLILYMSYCMSCTISRRLMVAGAAF